MWFTEKPGVDGTVFGSNDQWKGLGIFLDSFDNDALVSFMDGCLFFFREIEIILFNKRKDLLSTLIFRTVVIFLSAYY